MATTPVTMSVEEYLRSSFEPDLDYVDGWLEERYLGEVDHARLQTYISALLLQHEVEWNVSVSVEVRVQVAPTRFRVPDVCVTGGSLVEQIVRTPPLLCIEVMCPEDRLKEVLYKLEDYHRMGVVECWVFDPEQRKAWSSRDGAVAEWIDGDLDVPGTEIRLNPAEVFARVFRGRQDRAKVAEWSWVLGPLRGCLDKVR